VSEILGGLGLDPNASEKTNQETRG
jgi:hypothetical protein